MKRKAKPPKEQSRAILQQNVFLKKDEIEVSEDIRPGTLNDFVQMAKKQQNHDHLCDTNVLNCRNKELDQNSRIIKQQGMNQILSFIIVILILGGFFSSSTSRITMQQVWLLA